jgi:nucleotide-binding universal stress UspA family protein
MFSKVLVPLDGSKLAEGILPYVESLVRGLSCEVALVSVINEQSATALSRTREYNRSQPFREFLESAEGQAMNYLSEIKRERFSDAEYGVAVGSPAESIIQEQKNRGCDLIAMCTHGRTGLTRSILGSVTDKVLHQSDVPLLKVRPQDTETSAHRLAYLLSLIVPLDGSELSENVLPYAEELSRRLSMEITLVEAINVRVNDAFFGGGYYVDPTPLEEELVEEAEKYLREVGQRLKSKGLRVTWRTLLDTPAQAIAETAKQTPGGLIAISTRGSSGVTRFLIGSVTEKVVRNAGGPVLVVPPR